MRQIAGWINIGYDRGEIERVQQCYVSSVKCQVSNVAI